MVASLDGLTNPLVECFEIGARMEDAAKDFAIAHEDAAVKTVVNSVPGLEHRTELWKRGVDSHEFGFLAFGTVPTVAHYGHLAAIEIAPNSGYVTIAD